MRRLALLASLLPVLALSAVAFELPSNAPAEYYVSLTIARSGREQGYAGALPVEVREVRPVSPDQTRAWDHILPTGYEWSFKAGHGQLLSKSTNQPCRTFVLGLPELRGHELKAKLRGLCPASLRDPILLRNLDAMALAVTGGKTRDLSALFPVPFAVAPPQIAGQNTLLAMKPAPGQQDQYASTWKLGGAMEALGRWLVRKSVIDCPQEVWAQQRRLTDALDVEPYKTFQACPGVNGKWSCFFLRDQDLDGLMEDLVKRWWADSPDMFKFQPWLGAVPVADVKKPDGSKVDPVMELDFGADLQVGLEGSKPYRLTMHPGAQLDGTVDFDGCAFPIPDTKRLDVRFSQYAALSPTKLGFALRRNLLRAWRWREILERPSEPMTQTLLRITEPLWDFLTARTVSWAEDKMDKLALEGQLQTLWVTISRPDVARSICEKRGVQGAYGDGYYPLGDAIDHELAALMLTAMEGAGQKETIWEVPGYVAGGAVMGVGWIGLYGLQSPLRVWQKTQDYFKSKNAARRLASQTKVAQQTAQLLSHGFTRDEAVLDLQTTLQSLGHTQNLPPNPKREPDLLFLERAYSSPITPTLEASLRSTLANMAGTRAQKALKMLVEDNAVKAIEWEQTAPAQGSLYCVITTETMPAVLNCLTYTKRVYKDYATSPENVSSTVRVYSGIADKPEAQSIEDWWSAWSTQLTSPTVTAAEVKAYNYLRLAAKVDQAEKELGDRAAAVSPTYVSVIALKPSDGDALVAADPVGEDQTSLLKGLAACQEMIATLGTTGTQAARTKYFWKYQVKPLFVEAADLRSKLWEQFLIGAGLDTGPPPFDRFKNLFTWGAKLTGKTVKLVKTAGGPLTLQ